MSSPDVVPATQPDPPGKTSPRSSLGAVSLLSGCLLTQFVMQFAYQLLLAKWFGAGIEMDAFSTAQAISMVVATILVGSLQYAFVPVFVQRREQFGADAAWELAGTTGAILIPGIALLSLAGCLAATPIIQCFGFSPAQEALTIRQFQVLVWLTWTISVTAFFQTVLQAAQIYRPAAIGPLVGTAATFAASWYLSDAWGIQGIAWATLGGALVGMAWQAPVFCRNARFRWRFDAGMRQMWLMLIPILLGAGIYKLDPLLDRYLVAWLQLPEGSISQMAYASRLIAALLTLTSNGLAMVVFPVLSAYAASGNRIGLKVELVHALQFLVFLLVPVCLGLGWYAEPVVRDLFERGRFTPQDTAAVSQLLVLYLGVLIGGSLGEILSKTFFSLSDSRTPTIVRMIGFVVGAALKLWWGLQFGMAGLVWATSVYYLLISALDGILLFRRLGSISFAELLESLWKCGCGSVAAIIAASFLLSSHFSSMIIPAAIGSGIAYLAAMILLRDSIALRLTAAIRQRLWPK